MLALKLIINFNKQHELLIITRVNFFQFVKLTISSHKLKATKTIAKGFHSLLHNLN